VDASASSSRADTWAVAASVALATQPQRGGSLGCGSCGNAHVSARLAAHLSGPWRRRYKLRSAAPCSPRTPLIFYCVWHPAGGATDFQRQILETRMHPVTQTTSGGSVFTLMLPPSMSSTARRWAAASLTPARWREADCRRSAQVPAPRNSTAVASLVVLAKLLPPQSLHVAFWRSCVQKALM
jgi:hypothetical protein